MKPAVDTSSLRVHIDIGATLHTARCSHTSRMYREQGVKDCFRFEIGLLTHCSAPFQESSFWILKVKNDWWLCLFNNDIPTRNVV
jgi:hypothetical protein